jgi:hypothetical protein
MKQKKEHTMRTILFASLALLAATVSAQAPAPVAAPEGAAVYFITPQDGATVSGPVTVKFGLKGMGVAPAGIERANTGHHHLLVDVDELPPAGQPVPADAQHIHFGGGQTETKLELAPGKHTLQLLLGDHLHRPHQPPVLSEKITITVK